MSVYYASKAFVLSFSEALSGELAGTVTPSHAWALFRLDYANWLWSAHGQGLDGVGTCSVPTSHKEGLASV